MIDCKTKKKGADCRGEKKKIEGERGRERRGLAGNKGDGELIELYTERGSGGEGDEGSLSSWESETGK